MSAPVNDAEEARRLARHTFGSADNAKVWATLALADAIRTAANTLARAMVDAAQIRGRSQR